LKNFRFVARYRNEIESEGVNVALAQIGPNQGQLQVFGEKMRFRTVSLS